MKRLLCTILLLSCITALAGPVRPIRSSSFAPQAPAPNGPPLDPMAFQGQWFIDVNAPDESVRAWEFHDDDDTFSIAGHVVNIMWGTNSPAVGYTNILGFTIEATVMNNLSPESFGAGIASNSHYEVQMPPQPTYIDVMKGARIVAEFAVAEAGSFGPPWVGIAPNTFQMRPPYYLDPGSGNQYCIEAQGEPLVAWYCFEQPLPEHPNNPPGAYYVPAWELGDIPPGGSKTVLMDFMIKAYGGGYAEMPMTDIRHSVLRYSLQQGADVLYNRSESLKISHWIDLVLVDDNQSGLIHSVWDPWLIEELETNDISFVSASDVSIFFDSTYSDEKAVLEIDPIATNQSPDAVVLTWDALDAINYDIQYTDELSTNTSWTRVPGPGIPPTIPSLMSWTDDGTFPPSVSGQTNRFYRLIE